MQTHSRARVKLILSCFCLIVFHVNCTFKRTKLVCLESNPVFILPQRHMKNEKLVPTSLPDPKEREPYLPEPTGNNKLTSAMKPYYTGEYKFMREPL